MAPRPKEEFLTRLIMPERIDPFPFSGTAAETVVQLAKAWITTGMALCSLSSPSSCRYSRARSDHREAQTSRICSSQKFLARVSDAIPVLFETVPPGYRY